jgi:hypothetical protein
METVEELAGLPPATERAAGGRTARAAHGGRAA